MIARSGSLTSNAPRGARIEVDHRTAQVRKVAQRQGAEIVDRRTSFRRRRRAPDVDAAADRTAARLRVRERLHAHDGHRRHRGRNRHNGRNGEYAVAAVTISRTTIESCVLVSFVPLVSFVFSEPEHGLRGDQGRCARLRHGRPRACCAGRTVSVAGCAEWNSRSRFRHA